MNVEINKDIDKLVVVGDRVLIKPKSLKDQTGSGLFLPPGVQEKEKVQSGFIIKTGPGYPIPVVSDEQYEPWKKKEDKVKYIPLQAQEGDLAIYLQNGSIEITYNKEKYFIVPQSSILLLVRDDE